MSMKSIVKLNDNVEVANKPKGWVVRELLDKETNKIISLEFGIYVAEDMFIGVPIHYSLKSKFTAITNPYNDGYSYYLISNDLEVGLSVYKNKKGKVNPILVKPSEKYPAMKIACVAVAAEGASQIISTEVDNETITMVRDYIDKNRKFIVMIAAHTNTGIINPTIDITVSTGVKMSNTLTVKKFNIGMTSNIETATNSTGNNKVETQFIKFNRFIKKPAVNKEPKSE